MKVNLITKLVIRYRSLFDSIEVEGKGNITLCEHIPVDNGWWPLLDSLFSSIVSYMNTNRYPKLESLKFTIRSITNRNNKLSIRYTGGNDTINGMVVAVENLSQYICEKCGKITDETCILCKKCKRNIKWKKLIYQIYKPVLKIITKKK